jgi:hypothetical protein
VAGVDLSQQVVGSRRPTLLYMQASCAKNTKTNCGKLMRYQAAAAFNHSGPDVQVGGTACTACGAAAGGTVAGALQDWCCSALAAAGTGAGDCTRVVVLGGPPPF